MRRARSHLFPTDTKALQSFPPGFPQRADCGTGAMVVFQKTTSLELGAPQIRWCAAQARQHATSLSTWNVSPPGKGTAGAQTS